MPASFSTAETHGVLSRPEFEVRRSSDDLGWENLYASWQRERPYSSRCEARPDPLVVVGMGPPGRIRVRRRLAGAERTSTAVRRGMFILPAGHDYDLELLDPLETVHVYVRQSVVDEAASELDIGGGRGPGGIELVPRLGEHDGAIESIGFFCLEMLRDRQGGYVADAAARMLAARLVQHHSTAARPSPTERHGLSAAQVGRVEALMDASIEDGLSLAEMAASICLSPIHFARMFRRSTGSSPHQRLIELRLARAKHLLGDSASPIAEIAQRCGFSNQEHLTRAFGRAVGLTPAAYRRSRRD